MACTVERLAHRIASHRTAIAADEHPIRARPARHVLSQDRKDMRRNRNCALARIGLRVSIERRRAGLGHPLGPGRALGHAASPSIWTCRPAPHRRRRATDPPRGNCKADELDLPATQDPLPRPCVDALREHKKRQFAERADAWPDWEDHGLVFPSRRGTPMEPDNLRRSWTAIRTDARLGAIRFHDLRHTCVTLLLDLGAPPHVVREIPGHSDIEVTMTIYAHVSLDEKRKALGKLGEALG